MKYMWDTAARTHMGGGAHGGDPVEVEAQATAGTRQRRGRYRRARFVGVRGATAAQTDARTRQ